MSQEQQSKLDSEKTKDIRTTNIIAAKGIAFLVNFTNNFVFSCR
jgi:hypothetical protein